MSHELLQLRLLLRPLRLVVEAAVSPLAEDVQLGELPVVGVSQVLLQRAAVQLLLAREHQDGAGQDGGPEELLEAPDRLPILLGEAAQRRHQEHRVRPRRQEGDGFAGAPSAPWRRRPRGQEAGGVDDLELLPRPRSAPPLEGLGHGPSADLGLEHSPAEDAVSCCAFPASGFSHQDEPQPLRGPFILPQPWKHPEKVGGRG